MLPPLVPPAAALTSAELARYSRQILLPEWGVEGQCRLKNSRVLVVGAGGLGSPALLYLAAAGVGTLGIVDDDVVEESNLQRQIIHGTSDVGRLKAHSARDSITELNPWVAVEMHPLRLSPDNAVDLFTRYDLVIDGTDNFATRYLVNDAAVVSKKPYVWGSIQGFAGQVSVFWEDAPVSPRGQHRGINYRDLYPRPPAEPAILCRRWGVGTAVRVGGRDHGHGNDQTDHRDRGAVAGPADDLRRPGHDLPHHRHPQRPTGGADQRTGGLRDAIRGRREQRIGRRDHPRELRGLLDADMPVALIDVREPVEWEINRIDGAVLIPASVLTTDAGRARIPPGAIPVLYCKTGARSAEARATLLSAGFTETRHLQGGIVAWATQFDPDMAMY